MALTVEQFTERVASSGVLSEDQLRESLAGLPADAAARSDGDALARELVKQKKLTKFQAEQIHAGKGKSLTLGNYVLLDKLGEGGMGMVLKAYHRRMERTVALKVIAPKVVKEASALKRFQREVVAAAKLTHPNIVAAYDADEAKGTHFLVMEYVEGSDLSSWVKEHGPLPVEQAVNCIIQAARGLAFAHDKGVVHRDIKPHNLLMDGSGTVKILDMGLARIEAGFGGSAEHADLTKSGAMMGTVDYMAPEQAMDSKHADARSDIYSLGCTLFYLVTGHVAFEADTVMKRLTAHQSAPPPSMAEQLRVQSSESKSGLSSVALDSGLATLDAVFQRMVAKKPDDRPQSMLQVIAELERCVTSGSATVSVASGSNPVARPSAPTNAPANVSNRDADTIIGSSSDSKTNAALSDATVVLDSSVVKNPTAGATTSSIKSRKVILISAATVVVLLVIAFAMSGKSRQPSGDKLVANPPKPDAQSSESPPTNSEGVDPSDPPAAPPSSAVPAEALTFGGHRYLLVNEPSPWEEARTKAESLGGHLATINSQAELEWVRKNFVGDKPFNFGAIHSKNTSSWEWVTGEPFLSSLWPAGKSSEFDKDSRAYLAWSNNAVNEWIIRKPQFSKVPLPFLVEWEVLDLATPPPVKDVAPPPAVAPFDAAQAKANQAAWAKHLGTTVETTNSLGAKLLLIPPGEFLMGTSDEQMAAAVLDAIERERGQDVANAIRINERPQHRVVITKPFQLGATEVTVGQFKKFVEATGHQTVAEKNMLNANSATYLKPSYPITDESPVSCVGGYDVAAFCRWLSEKEQATYRLPTEAEWEYACRAGTTTAYSCGETLLDSHEWSLRNSDSKPQPVATKRPNPWGLFDVHGNLSEWCQDRFDEKWYQQSPLNDPLNDSSGPPHVYVVRGGHFGYHCILRSAYRTPQSQNVFHPTIGFRVVREINASTPAVNISPDRRAAEWVIVQGGEVTLSGRQPWIATVNDLPEGDLEVRLIKFKRRLSGEDADLVPLRELKHLEFVGIDYTHPTPAGITALARLPKLERVSCGAQPLSDEQVTALGRLNNVTSLFLAGAQLKPAQCAILAKSMPQIRSLNLMNNPLLDDAALAPLGEMRNLKVVQLQGTKVTAAGIAKLRQALPNCEIQWDGAATSANPPIAAPGGAVDLLALVDVKRDALAGEWTREANSLKVKQAGSTSNVPRLQLPYQPPEEYDFEIEFTQGNGNGTVEQLLSAQSRSFAWVLNFVLKDGVKAGFETLDGMNLVNRKDASIMRPKPLDPGRRYRSRVEVRKGKLRAFLDDELLVEWSGDVQRLDIVPRNALRNTQHLGLAANDRGVLFHKVTVREVSGSGKLTVGAAAGEANSTWTDWLGPKLKQGNFFDHFDGRQGWQRENDGVTTTNVISGQEVLRGTTRDGAVRLTYLLRDSKLIAINARDRTTNGMRELYVAEDHGTQLLIALVQGGAYKNLIKQPIPASIPKDAPRTLEFRIVGDTLTATVNGSVVATVKEATLTEGNFALVALKGVLVQKVEYQKLDEPK